MKIELYYCPGSASWCVHWMLIEMGIPFEAKMVSIEKREHKSEEFLKINPEGRLPVLVIDGKVYTESVAHLIILSEQCQRLRPAVGTHEHSKWLELMLVFGNGLQPPFRHWFYALQEAEGNVEHANFLKELTRKEIEAVWDRIDTHLSDGRKYLVGDQLTSVDFLGTMLMRWSRKENNMDKPATEWPNINKYVQRMRSLPSFIELNKREGLTVWLN